MPASPCPSDRRRRRALLAAGLWLAFGVAIGIDVLDVYVRSATKAYHARYALYEQGTGPRVTIEEVMAPAIRSGYRAATAWAGAVACLGLAAVTLARRQERG
jgi:hypothetical protein